MFKNSFLSFRAACIPATLVLMMTMIAADVAHTRVVDPFSTPKNWVSEVISQQNPGPLYPVGVWSDPINGPSLKTENGKGYFHFPRLESWVLQGFEYAYHLSHNNNGFELPGDTNYLTFNIVNKSTEPVWMKFRLMDEIRYTYQKENTQAEALTELVTEPDTFSIKPNASPQKIRLKLMHPDLAILNIVDPVYKNRIKFFAFETRRTVSSTKRRPTLDCTLVMDHLQIEDETSVK
jgi:hypothetical protein